MGKMSREKGKRGEREVRDVLRAHGFKDARRGQQYCGANGDADVVGLPGVHIEVKRVEKTMVWDWLSQAKADAAKRNERPIVVHRKNNTEWVVIQPLEDWLDLYAEGMEAYED